MPAGDLIRWRVLSATGSGSVWCYEPEYQFDLGVARHHRLLPPQGEHA